MGKVELKVEVDEDLVSQLEGSGVDPIEAARAGLRAAAERVPPGTRGRRSPAPWPQRSSPATAERLSAEWAERNRDALDEHRRLVESRGSFADSTRRW